MIPIGQPHGAEQEPDRDLAGEIVDELERLLLDDAVERPIGNFQRRADQPVEIALKKRRLAERAQAIVARRISGPERSASPPGKLIDHIALRRGEGFPVARRLNDVVVARQYPELRVIAPVAGVLGAQFRVIRKRIGIDHGRVEVESFHGISSRSRR